MISYPEPFPFLVTFWGTRRSPATVIMWIGLQDCSGAPSATSCLPNSYCLRNCCSRTNNPLSTVSISWESNQFIQLVKLITAPCIYIYVQLGTQIKGQLAVSIWHWSEEEKGVPWPGWGEKSNSSNIGGSWGAEIGLKMWARYMYCARQHSYLLWMDRQIGKKQLLKCIDKQLWPTAWYCINAGWQAPLVHS